MNPAVIVYASRHGHTGRIAGQLAESPLAREIPSDLIDAARIPPEFRYPPSPPRSSSRPFISAATNPR